MRYIVTERKLLFHTRLQNKRVRRVFGRDLPHSVGDIVFLFNLAKSNISESIQRDDVEISGIGEAVSDSVEM